ncbi:DUF4190 domain-containing protein [Paramicrobacterium sp. CJ85]|uniref:DUF4190 domain-containing protein n=1 Tax=Paramicrobacterium sp. CJ85 TaxID=3445355 RepID=UPI003F61A4F0
MNPINSEQSNPQAGSRTMAVWALLLGIITVILAFVPIVGMVSWIAAIVGLVLGIIALARRLAGRGMAITGIVLSSVAVILSIVMTVVYMMAGLVWAVLAVQNSELNDDRPSATASPTPVGPTEGSGTEESPFVVGQTFEVPRSEGGSWSVTITSAELDANDQIDNPYTDGLPEDEIPQYALLEVTLEYDGEEPSLVPLMELSFGYLSPTGDELWATPSSDIETPGTSFAELESMDPGDSETVDVVVPVLPGGGSSDDAETVADGLWMVKSSLADDTFYVELQ